jgi:ABC-type antimicrobial peptide transport system permease subunit
VASTLAMSEYVERSVERRSLASRVLTTFSVFALILVAIGVFAVLSLAIGQRQREMAIRMALGAAPAHISRSVLQIGFIPVLGGIAAGSVLSIGLARFLESLLYEVSPFDPVAIGVAAVTVLLATGLACLAPTMRALRIEPATELRV